MGHNSVVSGYLKSTGIPIVDGLSIGTPGFYGVTTFPLEKFLFFALCFESSNG